MEILTRALGALWQVAAVGLLLGAGLPALFALGLRFLNTGRLPLADGPVLTSKPSRLGVAGAAVCFGVMIAAVVFGIVVVIFGKRLFGS
jgi:hypothetical protein